MPSVARLARARQAPSSPAPTTQAANRIELHQALLDLTNPWTVMCIAAHPDDEDGTSLVVMRRKFGAHTVSLFSTFGEGGQNAIGPELYEELGAIRVRETMAAAEIQGSEPYFLGLKDFGFSKSADEAFRVWGHDEALARMVLQIRKLRPDVIITNHSATNNDHGHHQATARLELEAFDAAADPRRFPEQLKDVSVWQVQRLFVRAGRSSQAQTDTASLVTIDPNELDPVRGKVYAEEALEALQKHATQGPWPRSVAQLAARFNSPDGRLPLTRYRLAREAKGAAALPQDSHNFLDGLRLPESVASELDIPTIDGRPLVEFADDRAKVLEALLKHVRKGFRFSVDSANFERRSLMQDRLNRATTLAAGVSLQVEALDSTTVTRNSSTQFRLRLTNDGTQNVSVFGCYSQIPPLRDRGKDKGGPTSILESSADLKAGATLTRSTQLLIPANAAINIPLASHLYEPTGLGLRVRTSCEVALGPGFHDRLSAEETTNVDVSFPIEVTGIEPTPVVISPQSESITKTLTLKMQAINHGKTGVQTAIEMTAGNDQPNNRKPRVIETPLTLAPNEKREVRIMLPLKTEKVLVARPMEIRSIGTKNSAVPSPPPVAPEHLLVFRTTDKSSNEVTVPFVYADARVAPHLRVGYVRGFDYSLRNALDALGVESKELTIDEVKTADLRKYTTIIVDNRVYESQPELIAANQRLLDYAKDGGTLIVFYHKSNEWNPDERRKRPQLAPYKLILGDERVTDETAPITFLEPGHPLLNAPNKIGQEDFANWIQERGLYYPRDWDAQYSALFASNDPGEQPLKGGLLVAKYGKGNYIYTSMVWYRELRAGVPGAYRVFANMISYK